MRPINMIVVHCSATKETSSYTVEQLKKDHLARGFNEIGYHFYVRRNGIIEQCRAVSEPGAHALGFNAHSIAICYEGGLSSSGKPKDTRTEAQKGSMQELVTTLKAKYRITQICGHRDLSPDLNGNGTVEPNEWIKVCPCFDVNSDSSLRI